VSGFLKAPLEGRLGDSHNGTAKSHIMMRASIVRRKKETGEHGKAAAEQSTSQNEPFRSSHTARSNVKRTGKTCGRMRKGEREERDGKTKCRTNSWVGRRSKKGEDKPEDSRV